MLALIKFLRLLSLFSEFLPIQYTISSLSWMWLSLMKNAWSAFQCSVCPFIVWDCREQVLKVFVTVILAFVGLIQSHLRAFSMLPSCHHALWAFLWNILSKHVGYRIWMRSIHTMSLSKSVLRGEKLSVMRIERPIWGVVITRLNYLNELSAYNSLIRE